MRAWPTGGLWRHPDFLKLWSAETISQFGSQVGQLALPLVAVIALESTPFEVAALGTIAFLPFTLIGSLAAALTMGRSTGRFGVGRMTLAATFLQGPALLLLALASVNAPIPFLIASGLLTGFNLVVLASTRSASGKQSVRSASRVA